MKIAQVSATFPPYMGGTGNVCYHYAKGLAGLGHDVTVFTSRYSDDGKSDHDNFSINRFRPLFRIGNAPCIPQLLGMEKPDTIHLHYPFYFGGEMLYLLKKIRGYDYIVSYHNNVVLEGFLKYPVSLHTKIISRQILASAERIIVPTMDFFSTLVQPRFSLPEEKVIEIPNGVDLSCFSGDGNAIRQRYGIPDESRVILFVGALDTAHYYKGLEVLMQSVQLLKSRTPPAILLVVGDGDLKSQYQSLARHLGIQDRTIFTGTIPDFPDLARHYLASDIVIYPTVADSIESFGMVAAEGMAAGRPVIASNIPGVRAVVEHEKTGFLFQPGNPSALAEKIEVLLSDESLCRRLGKNGREKAEKEYNWDSIIQRLEGVYLNR